MIKISVIMPTYNRGYIIARAIESVLNQHFSDWELVIVDDGSDDNTAEIVAEYREKRIKYITNEERGGACYARNIGMKNASGTHFCFLDSDCSWDERFLSERVKAAINCDPDLIYGRMKHIKDENINVWPFEETEYLSDQDYVKKTLVLRNLIDTNTVLLKRGCWEQQGGFDTDFQRLQDWEYFSRILHAEKYNVLFQDEPLVNNYIQDDSISENNPWGVWRIKLFEKHIDFCRRKKILTDVVETLFLDDHDFRGNDNYREDLCRLLTKDELCCLMYRMGNTIDEKNKQLFEKDALLRKSIKIQDELRIWLMAELQKKRIYDYLRCRKIKRIAVYGFGILGRLLYEYLLESDISVSCIIDRNKQNIKDFTGCKLLSAEDAKAEKLDVDAIIVTAIVEYSLIEADMSLYNIIPLENIMHELNEKLASTAFVK